MAERRLSFKQKDISLITKGFHISTKSWKCTGFHNLGPHYSLKIVETPCQHKIIKSTFTISSRFPQKYPIPPSTSASTFFQHFSSLFALCRRLNNKTQESNVSITQKYNTSNSYWFLDNPLTCKSPMGFLFNKESKFLRVSFHLAVAKIRKCASLCAWWYIQGKYSQSKTYRLLEIIQGH